jgi:hypothetical protein
MLADTLMADGGVISTLVSSVDVVVLIVVVGSFVSSFKLGSFAGPVIQANESSVVIFSIVVDFVVVTIGCRIVGVVDIVVLLVVGVDDVTVVVVVVVVVVLLVVDVTVVVLVVVSDVVDGFSVLVTEIVDDGFGLLTGAAMDSLGSV